MSIIIIMRLEAHDLSNVPDHVNGANCCIPKAPVKVNGCLMACMNFSQLVGWLVSQSVSHQQKI